MKKTILARIPVLFNLMGNVFRSVWLAVCPQFLQPKAKYQPIRVSDADLQLILRDSKYVTVNEAMYILKVSRTKLTDMRRKKELTTIVINGHVRLIREEVDQAVICYTIPKGKK